MPLRLVSLAQIRSATNSLSSVFESHRKNCPTFENADLIILATLHLCVSFENNSSFPLPGSLYLKDATDIFPVQFSACFQQDCFDAPILITSWRLIAPLHCPHSQDRHNLTYIEIISLPLLCNPSSFQMLKKAKIGQDLYKDDIVQALLQQQIPASYTLKEATEKSSTSPSHINSLSFGAVINAISCIHLPCLKDQHPLFFIKVIPFPNQRQLIQQNISGSSQTSLVIVFKGKKEAQWHFSLFVGQNLFLNNLIPSIAFPRSQESHRVLSFKASTSSILSLKSHDTSQSQSLTMSSPQASGVISYHGKITKVIDVALGIYELDNKVSLFLSHFPQIHYGRGWRQGATVKLQNVHVVSCRFDLCRRKSIVALAACSYSSVQVSCFSQERTPYLQNSPYPKSRFSPFRHQLTVKQIILLSFLFDDLKERFKERFNDEALLGSFNSTGSLNILEERKGVLWQILKVTGFRPMQRQLFHEFFEHPRHCKVATFQDEKVIFPTMDDVHQYIDSMMLTSSSASNNSTSNMNLFEMKRIHSSKLSSCRIFLIGILKGNCMGKLVLADGTGSIRVVLEDEWECSPECSQIWICKSFTLVLEILGTSEDGKTKLYKHYLLLKREDLVPIQREPSAVVKVDKYPKGTTLNSIIKDKQRKPGERYLHFLFHRHTSTYIAQPGGGSESHIITILLHGKRVSMNKEGELSLAAVTIAVPTSFSPFVPFLIPAHLYSIVLPEHSFEISMKGEDFFEPEKMNVVEDIGHMDSFLFPEALKKSKAFPSVQSVTEFAEKLTLTKRSDPFIANLRGKVIRKGFREVSSSWFPSLDEKSLWTQCDLGTGKKGRVLYFQIQDEKQTENVIHLTWRQDLLEYPVSLLPGMLVHFYNIEGNAAPGEVGGIHAFYHSFSSFSIEKANCPSHIVTEDTTIIPTLEALTCFISDSYSLSHTNLTIIGNIEAIHTISISCNCRGCGRVVSPQHSHHAHCGKDPFRLEAKVVCLVGDGSGEALLTMNALDAIMILLRMEEKDKTMFVEFAISNGTIEVTRFDPVADLPLVLQWLRNRWQEVEESRHQLYSFHCLCELRQDSHLVEAVSWCPGFGSQKMKKSPRVAFNCKKLRRMSAYEVATQYFAALP